MPYKEKPIKKKYFKTKEVADMFDVPASTIRYWEKEFEILKPGRNKRGHRRYTEKDLDNLRVIYYLLKGERYTIEGAKFRIGYEDFGSLKYNAERWGTITIVF